MADELMQTVKVTDASMGIQMSSYYWPRPREMPFKQCK